MLYRKELVMNMFEVELKIRPAHKLWLKEYRVKITAPTPTMTMHKKQLRYTMIE